MLSKPPLIPNSGSFSSYQTYQSVSPLNNQGQTNRISR